MFIFYFFRVVIIAVEKNAYISRMRAVTYLLKCSIIFPVISFEISFPGISIFGELIINKSDNA